MTKINSVEDGVDCVDDYLRIKQDYLTRFRNILLVIVMLLVGGDFSYLAFVTIFKEESLRDQLQSFVETLPNNS